MSFLKSIIRSKYTLWFIIMIPCLMMTIGLLNNRMTYGSVMHTSGEFSARMLIFALIATPVGLLFPRSRFANWLMRNRRYFGVAAFIYGIYHTLYYLFYIPTSTVLGEFFDFGIITGWIAIFIFTPQAITSNDASVRRMKGAWKKLQRWVHLAAICIVLHWMFIHYHFMPAIVHFTPVALLQVYRVWKLNKGKTEPQVDAV